MSVFTVRIAAFGVLTGMTLPVSEIRTLIGRVRDHANALLEALDNGAPLNTVLMSVQEIVPMVMDVILYSDEGSNAGNDATAKH